MSLDSDSVFCKRCSGNGGAGCLKRCGCVYPYPRVRIYSPAAAV